MLRSLRNVLIVAAACLPLLQPHPLAAADNQPFALHDGDTVVFYGDSITDQRLYTMLTELYVVTRYPKLDVKFVHSGWGGDRVSGGGGGPVDLRLQRDVFAYHPTVMTIMLGMNDGHYTEHKPADDDAFYSGFKHIVDSVRQTVPNIRITAIEPSPFDDVTRPFTLQPNGYNAVLMKYSDWIEHYATEGGNHLTVASFNTPVVDMLKKANATDGAVAQKILPDRVHPSLSGHLIMAEQLVKAWGGRPLVSSIEIDAQGGKLTRETDTQVSNLKNDAGLSWTALDDALPLPWADMLKGDREGTLGLAMKSSDVTVALNQQIVKIAGLRPGRYTLAIDGAPVGTWSDADWSNGVNLAAVATPMSKQAMDVRDLTVRHLDIHQFRWRTLQVPLGDSGIDHLNDTMTNLDSIEAAVVKQQRSAAQPHAHEFHLSPAS